MMKRMAFVAAALLCGLLGGCVMPPASAQTVWKEGEETAAPLDNREEQEADTFAPYTAFGLTFDEKTRSLTYDGQRVRYFEDVYPIVWNTPKDGMAGVDFFDEEGVIDVYATRDLSVRRENGDGSYDPSGVLTGLAPFSQAEFDARDLEPLRTPQTDATSGEPMTEAERKAAYAPYAAYGLTYDAKKDLLFYGGAQVRRFLDVFTTNGEAPESGKFEGSMTSRFDEGGTVDVFAVRDYEKPGRDGFGTLTGLRAATKAEFDAQTDSLTKTAPQIRYFGQSTTDCAQEG